MNIVKNRKIFYAFSILLLAVAVFSFASWGLKYGVDFTGGSSLSMYYEGSSPSLEQVSGVFKKAGFDEAVVRSSDGGFIVKLREIDNTKKESLIKDLSFGGSFKPVEKDFSSIGPVLGSEAAQKSIIAIVLVILAIVIFVAFAFRHVSRPLQSWVYGVVTIIALLHDVFVPVGVFSILGHFLGYEVDTLFVTAILVILGFSVHDTIVVFDRVRENLSKRRSVSGTQEFEDIVGESVSETMTRSINTSFTTVLTVIVLYFVGPESIRHFALALIIGIVAGTYSSIFIGSPLLVTINNYLHKKSKK